MIVASPAAASSQQPADGNTDAVASMSFATGTFAPLPEAAVADLLTTELRDTILSVITQVVRHWGTIARFEDVRIDTMIAQAGANCLRSPKLWDLRGMASGYHATQDLEREVMDMALRAVSDNFALWQYFVVVPGLPIFPSFAAVPMPLMPPTPAIPTPLGAFASGQANKITSATQLRDAMRDEAPNAFEWSEISDFCMNIGQCCAMGFNIFLSTQIVSGLMGTGPVPSFAPPLSPVGPVIGGHVLPVPGVLANPGAFSIPKLPMA